MKFRVIFLSVFVLSLLALSCSSKLSEEEYYEKAKEAYSKEQYNKAMDYFKKILEYYPQGKRAAESLFMLGFINANDLKNYDEAKKYYQQFVDKYPDHELADDAQYEIKTMGKDLDELPFLQDLGADSASASK